MSDEQLIAISLTRAEWIVLLSAVDFGLGQLEPEELDPTYDAIRKADKQLCWP